MRTIITTLERLGADRRGVTAREIWVHGDHAERDVRAALEAACASGRVVRAGRTPAGAELYSLGQEPSIGFARPGWMSGTAPGPVPPLTP